MGIRLLVLEEHATPPEASVRAGLALDRDYTCRTASWAAAAHGSDAWWRSDAQALVAVAVPHTADVARVFAWLRDHPVAIPILAVLPSDASGPVVRDAVATVDDFVLAPVRALELRHRLDRMVGTPSTERAAVRERLLDELGLMQLIGRDPVFLQAIEHVPRFARSDAPVLITGETGTGKELCARAIHFFSKRRDRAFVAVDCAALPDHLVENELFGHARGAYTDAHRDHQGLIAMADGGTLFLDEIDALSPVVQAKLLRFLQEHTYRPLGADRTHHADLDVIAATNRDLERLVADRQFRADLFYRLNVLRLHLPPLRERRGDIALLASYFLQQPRASAVVGPQSFSASALRTLLLHDWPGNVRELSNVVRRAAVACEDRVILSSHLAVRGLRDAGASATASFRQARAAAIAAFEQHYVEELLRRHAGNVTHAARAAHKERRAFGRLVKKYNVTTARA